MANPKIPLEPMMYPGSDGSGTITTGGTAQNLFGGVAPLHGFAIYNPDATNDLWINDAGAAAVATAGSIRVAANGGSYVTPDFYIPVGPVSIVGATTGGKYTAKQW